MSEDQEVAVIGQGDGKFQILKKENGTYVKDVLLLDDSSTYNSFRGAFITPDKSYLMACAYKGQFIL